MKRPLPPLLVFALLSVFAAPAWAEWNSGNDIFTETEPLGAKIIMDFAENMPWIPDGADTGKYLYIIADAGCPVSKQLYTMSRKYAHDVQIRWIFVDPDAEGTYNSLYEERTPEVLKAAFMDQTLPDDKDPKKSEKIDQYVLKGFLVMLARQVIAPSPDRFVVPTMIYGDEKKAVVNAGLDPSDLGNIIASIPTVPVKSGFTPLALSADQATVVLKPVPAGYRYVNNNAENAPMYMMPDQNSPRVGSLVPKGDFPFPCVGVTESGFFAIRVFEPKDGQVYCYDPVEAERILKK